MLRVWDSGRAHHSPEDRGQESPTQKTVSRDQSKIRRGYKICADDITLTSHKVDWCSISHSLLQSRSVASGSPETIGYLLLVLLTAEHSSHHSGEREGQSEQSMYPVNLKVKQLFVLLQQLPLLCQQSGIPITNAITNRVAEIG